MLSYNIMLLYLKIKTKMKKIKMFKTFGLGIILLSLFNVVSAQQSQAQGWFFNPTTQYKPNVPGPENLAGEGLLLGIKNFINYVLGLLAVIALVILLWWGFQMVTAAGDDNKYKKWFTILKQAGIGLILIGLAWLIVSFFFYIVGIMVGG